VRAYYREFSEFFNAQRETAPGWKGIPLAGKAFAFVKKIRAEFPDFSNEEVLEATYLALRWLCPRYDPAKYSGKNRFKNFLRLLGRNVRRVIRRRRERRDQAWAGVLYVPLDTSDPPDHREAGRYDRVDDRDEVEVLLARLTEDERELVTLRFLDGLSAREIAAKTGVSHTAVLKRLAAATARLAG
jgi:RNA polymerase sigma factor (sigma-70 family)